MIKGAKLLPVGTIIKADNGDRLELVAHNSNKRTKTVWADFRVLTPGLMETGGHIELDYKTIRYGYSVEYRK